MHRSAHTVTLVSPWHGIADTLARECMAGVLGDHHTMNAVTGGRRSSEECPLGFAMPVGSRQQHAPSQPGACFSVQSLPSPQSPIRLEQIEDVIWGNVSALVVPCSPG